MSAAYYLARLGYPVTVFEAMPVPGGMMAIGIPEYRLPREVLREEIARIVGLGVELRLDTAMGRDFTLGDLEREGFRAVFLATGASKSRRLGVPGDDLPGVVPATLFLKQVNLGEDPRLSGHVVVVGGGSTAMDAARSALRSGASSVTVAYRRGRAEMPAQEEEIEAAEREGIVIRPGLAVAEVVGRDGAVVALRCTEQRPTGEVDRGRAVWAPVPDSMVELPASTILVAVGEEPDPSILPEGAGIEVSGWAGIVADPRTLATGRAGIFAGGDVVSGPKTIIDAVASGRRAAGSVHEFLAGVRDGEAEIMRTVRYATPPEPSLELDIAPRPRAHAPLPVFDAGLLPGRPSRASTRRPPAARPRAASAATRSTAAPRVAVRAGRGPADRPSLDVIALPAVGPPRGAAPGRHRRRPGMTPDQVSGFFDAGESFIEGTIGAALVVLWLLALGLHMARPYMAHTTGKFTLRLGRRPLVDHLRRPARHHPPAGVPRQLHLLLPGRDLGPAVAGHGRHRGRLRVRGPAHQADHAG